MQHASRPVYRRGDSSPDVAEIRRRLRGLGLLGGSAGAGMHGDAVAEDSESPVPHFGAGRGDDDGTDVFDEECERSVRAFQQTRGLLTDGVVGPQTWRALRGSRYTLGVRLLSYRPSAMMYGDDVSALQDRLLELGYDAGRADGILGAGTDGALRSFQRECGLRPDGVCGPDTIRALHQLGRKVTGGSPQMLREAEVIRRRGPSLRDKRIMIDPGHGDDHAGVAVGGVRESDIVWDVANLVSDLLLEVGAQPLITRAEEDDPEEYERAERCNDAGAELVVSLHIDQSGSEEAAGVAGFHYGTGSGTSGTVAERLAGLVAREIANRTGMAYLHTHGRTWDMLRLTSMPAVRIELGYLTNPSDRAVLADHEMRRRIAEAVVIGIQRMYLPPERDHHTGTLDVSELRRAL